MSSATEQEAYELLEKLGIPYHRVDHPAITSVKNLTIELPGPQVKNLVLKAKKGSAIYLVILPDEKQADLKNLAEQLEEKRLSFVSEEQLQTLRGVLRWYSYALCSNPRYRPSNNCSDRRFY